MVQLVLSFFCACLSFPAVYAVPPDIPREIRDLTRAPTRVVWYQDTGDGADAGIEESHSRLMGFDTEDARGERVILPDLSNYSRPMLTPRGNRVIFSNRKENRIYVVNWDGSGLRCLGNGYALGVWQDPADGVEWVYGGTPVPPDDAFYPIQRAPIDQPDRIETVWSRTPANADNFQISADGRRACGNLPWPVCGIVELPDRDWKKYGDGCWPSLAPGNANLMWIFDGAHRNLTLFRTDAEEHWVVNINHAPGIEGYEVYHPRWSNNARIMAMTGPYKLGEGDNRIRGGGPDVEIYLGRFDDRFRAIERWVRVTHNTRADFCPDAWIAPRAARGKPTEPSAVPQPENQSSTADLKNAWPGTTGGLIFTWENRSSKNEIHGADDAARKTGEQSTRICRAEPRGEARYGRFFEMDLSRGVFTTDPAVSEQILSACRTSNQFSVEAVVTPRQTDRPEFSRIISFTGGDSGNFILGQQRDRLVLRLNTPDPRGLSPDLLLCGLTPGMPQHVIVSYAPGRLTCYLNGSPLNVTNTFKDNLKSWVSGELIFGDRDRPWPGTLDHIALYNRTLAAPEANRKFNGIADQLKNRAPAARLVLDARLAEAAHIPTPASISPYRRALVVNRYDRLKVIRGRYTASKILAAHWVILDGRVLDAARRQRDTVYRLTLEPFDEHPELEGERLIMESEEFLLPLYYEVE